MWVLIFPLASGPQRSLTCPGHTCHCIPVVGAPAEPITALPGVQLRPSVYLQKAGITSEDQMCMETTWCRWCPYSLLLLLCFALFGFIFLKNMCMKGAVTSDTHQRLAVSSPSLPLIPTPSSEAHNAATAGKGQLLTSQTLSSPLESL